MHALESSLMRTGSECYDPCMTIPTYIGTEHTYIMHTIHTYSMTLYVRTYIDTQYKCCMYISTVHVCIQTHIDINHVFSSVQYIQEFTKALIAYIQYYIILFYRLEILSGFSREDVIGSNVLLYLYPNDIEITDEKHEEMLELGGC